LSEDLLIEHARRLAAALKPKGRLILAGILASRFDKVMEAYEALDWQLVKSKAEREWKSGTFRRAWPTSSPQRARASWRGAKKKPFGSSAGRTA
jgi:hypothetical protein